jgi:hypothetical protein
MRRFAAAAVCFSFLAAVAGAWTAIKPGRGMSGVSLGMTPAQVQAKLGRPLAKGGWRWYYTPVTVTFRARRVVELRTTRRTGERLANGLGLDSSEAQVRAALPQALCAPWSRYRRCRLGSGAPGSRVTDFLFGNNGRVIEITISQLP